VVMPFPTLRLPWPRRLPGILGSKGVFLLDRLGAGLLLGRAAGRAAVSLRVPGGGILTLGEANGRLAHEGAN